MNKRDALHKSWQDVLGRAYEAGDEAANAAVPTPMYVGTPRNVMASLMGGDDGGFDPNEPVYHVPEGVCGFAWVNVRGSQAFRNWLEGKGKSNYPASVALRHFGEGTWRETSSVSPPRYSPYDRATSVWVGGFGQSMSRKEAFASAFAKVVHEVEGVTAYAGSRMD